MQRALMALPYYGDSLAVSTPGILRQGCTTVHWMSRCEPPPPPPADRSNSLKWQFGEEMGAGTYAL